MAIVYPQATLTPSKRELMAAWLPTRSWYDGHEDRKPVGSFRFDDPAGEVGCEGFLLGSEGVPTLFLPLTYRGAELGGAEEHLVGTTEHSELGPRWVYDGCADPVFIGELVRVVLTGGTGVDHEYDIGNGPESRPTNAQVQGSGSGSASDVPLAEEVGCHDEGPLTIVNAGPLELAIARIVGTYVDAAETLAVTWKGGNDIVIAGVRPG
jgi:maltokinase-like protein